MAQRHVAAGNAAPQFSVDEIRQPPEQHAEGNADRNIVGHAQQVQPAAPRHPGQGKDDTHQPAVEAHAAVPQLQKLAGCLPTGSAVRYRPP
jgi:hypothetical protein